MPECLVAVGANLGDPQQQLDRAIELLAACPAVRIISKSSWIATIPVGGPVQQPFFLNGVVRLETKESPNEVLRTLRHVEVQMGRLRSSSWGPRIIDLDLLLYDQRLVNDPELVLPHPWMMVRDFVLSPACQIASDWIHPVVGRSLADLRDQLHASRLPIAVISGSQHLWESHRDLAHRAALASGFTPWTRALPAPWVVTQPPCQFYMHFDGTRTGVNLAIKSGQEDDDVVGLCICPSVEALLAQFPGSPSASLHSTSPDSVAPPMKLDMAQTIRAAILVEDWGLTERAERLPSNAPPQSIAAQPVSTAQPVGTARAVGTARGYQGSAAALQVARDLHLPFVRIDGSNPSTAMHHLQAALAGILAAVPS